MNKETKEVGNLIFFVRFGNKNSALTNNFAFRS